MYPVQYLHNRLPGTWTRTYSEACGNHGLGLRKEKSHRKEKAIYQRKRQIHILRNEKQFSNTKKKKKAKSRAMFKKKKLIQPQIVYVNLKKK